MLLLNRAGMQTMPCAEAGEEVVKSDSTSQLDRVFRYAYRNKDKLAPGSKEMTQLSKLMEGLKPLDFGLEDPTSTPRSTKATTECSQRSSIKAPPNHDCLFSPRVEFKQNMGKRRNSQGTIREATSKSRETASSLFYFPRDSAMIEKKPRRGVIQKNYTYLSSTHVVTPAASIAILDIQSHSQLVASICSLWTLGKGRSCYFLATVAEQKLASCENDPCLTAAFGRVPLFSVQKALEPYIGCRTVYGDKDLVMAVFLLPKGVAMPLHDHPGMTVASKLLYGMVEVEEYDWSITLSRQQAGRTLLALPAVASSQVDKPKGFCRKYTEKGDANEMKVHAIGAEYCNIHTFKAITNSAILDIITPPYDPKTRSPNFYNPTLLENGLYMMEKYMPSEFRCFEEPYHGPKVNIPNDLLRNEGSEMQMEK
eukprot:jgi/Bigna1/90180/estExt_fgenesh1_pg.C_640069